MQLARKHGAGGRDSRHTDVVEELRNAFELAERSSPGITNRYCVNDNILFMWGFVFGFYYSVNIGF